MPIQKHAMYIRMMHVFQRIESIHETQAGFSLKYKNIPTRYIFNINIQSVHPPFLSGVGVEPPTKLSKETEASQDLNFHRGITQGSRVQNHWVAPRSTQPFILPRSIKWVPGISRNLVVKSKLPLRSGCSLEAVEPHP